MWWYFFHSCFIVRAKASWYESETPTLCFLRLCNGGREGGDFPFILYYDWSNPQHTISFEPMVCVGVHVVQFPEPLIGGFAASEGLFQVNVI